MHCVWSRLFRRRYNRGARSASPAQMAAFTDAFSSYFSRKYGAQFNEFVGGRIDVKSTKAVKSFHEVKAIVEFRGGSKMELIFLVSDRSGRPLFFNIFMEGINMLLTERTEIGAMLDQRRGDLKALISDLEKTSMPFTCPHGRPISLIFEIDNILKKFLRK